MSADSTQRTGKTFAWIFWIGLLAMLYWLFEDKLAEQMNPNQQVESLREGNDVVVQLQQNRQGHYVANGEINGNTVVFLLDTGATQVAIPQAVADQLQLPRGAAQRVNTANGVATAYRTQLDELRLGDIILRDVSASIVPGMLGEHILLGMSALKQVEFTQRGQTLTIRY